MTTTLKKITSGEYIYRGFKLRQKRITGTAAELKEYGLNSTDWDLLTPETKNGFIVWETQDTAPTRAQLVSLVDDYIRRGITATAG